MRVIYENLISKPARKMMENRDLISVERFSRSSFTSRSSNFFVGEVIRRDYWSGGTGSQGEEE